MTFGSMFGTILRKRSLDLNTLAFRAELSPDKLSQAVIGDKELTEEQTQRIAEELAVPIAALYANQELPLSEVPDFRRTQVGKGQFDKGTIKAIGYVERISGSLASLPLDLSINEKIGEVDEPLTKGNARKLASKWRSAWAMTDSRQIDAKSAHTMYASLRNFIESQGIFVLHYTFGTDEVSGIYTRIQNGPHTIIINTTGSSKARKLFTLAHEFCHVLLRKNGASNPSIVKNKVEVFCNQFAAYLLAPESVINSAIKRYGYSPSLGGNFIRILSSNLGISQQCLMLRLVEMGIFSTTQYGSWIGKFANGTPKGDTEDGKGGKGDPIQNKRTQYGAAFLRTLSEAKKRGFLDDIDIFRLAGIKPKYQRDLLGVA